ncbi:MAG: helix-turn-helix domain-containing protein [Lachnospiraceae bacterium]|nr:helix-turn-helix domain-containing protein [Lachnospiraceae bacterium]
MTGIMKLSEAREKMNMTQESLANKMGVSRRSVSRWENIRKPSLPSMQQFLMLSRLLEVPERDFFIRREREYL